jgi:hypothetical protein
MPATTPSDKIMFEIYRTAPRDGAYRVIYFTELEEHEREREISRALHGEHVFDGYLSRAKRDEGKQAIQGLVQRLNNGDQLGADEIRGQLAPFIE